MGKRETSEIIRVSQNFDRMVREATAQLNKTSAEVTRDIANKMKRLK